MRDLRKDFSQEETFCQGLFDCLKAAPALRQVFFAYHTGSDSAQINGDLLQVFHRDKRHVLDGKRIEFDLFMLDEQQEHLLVVELKGRGGGEQGGQTQSIADAVGLHFPHSVHSLIFATWSGSEASSPSFVSINLHELLVPLRRFALVEESHEVSDFLADFDRDVEGLSDVVVLRRAIRRELHEMAGEMLVLAEEIVRMTPELTGFSVRTERAYDRDVASIHIYSEGWSGLRFLFAVKATPALGLIVRSSIIKHGRKNVRTLKWLRASLPEELLSAWRHRGVHVEDRFSRTQLQLAGYEVQMMADKDWRLLLREAVSDVLIPAVPLLNVLMASASSV